MIQELFKAQSTGLLLANGAHGALHFCELCTIASSIILPAETEPIRTRQKDVVFAIASSIILPARTEPIRIRDKNVVSASGAGCARNPLATSCKAKKPANQIPDGLGADTALPIAIPLLPNITCCTRKRYKSSCPKNLQQKDP